MESQNILRKLEIGEVNKNSSGLAANFMITVRLRSKIDLFADLNKLRDAIQTFKKMHPLLSAKAEKINDEFHFTIDENSSANRNLENVHFLRVKNENSVDDRFIFDRITEKCFYEWIDIQKEPDLLWRLIFLEIKGGEFAYEIFWQVNHIIADGLSVKENILLLLNIIEKKIRSEDVNPTDFGLYQGSAKVFEPEISSITERKAQPIAYKPGFIDPVKAKLNSTSIINKLIDGISHFDLFDLNSNRSYATFDELIDIPKHSQCKPKKFTIDENTYLKLLKKCKQEGVKVTSFLNVVNAISLLRLYKRYKCQTDQVLIWTAVDLRRFRPESEINANMMGYIVGALFETYPNIFESVDEDSEVETKFWSFARERDQELTDRVKNDKEKFSIKLRTRGDPEKEILVHSGLSNIGIIDPQKYLGVDSIFELENSYLLAVIAEHINSLLYYNYIVSMGNRLYWGINYNSFFFDINHIDEIIENIQYLIRKLIA